MKMYASFFHITILWYPLDLSTAKRHLAEGCGDSYAAFNLCFHFIYFI